MPAHLRAAERQPPPCGWPGGVAPKVAGWWERRGGGSKKCPHDVILLRSARKLLGEIWHDFRAEFLEHSGLLTTRSRHSSFQEAAIRPQEKHPQILSAAFLCGTRRADLHMRVAGPPPPISLPATTRLQMYACAVGLIISSGTDTCGGSVAMNSTALATSSGFIIFAC